MLLTNQRLDKLAASHVDFANRGMLEGTCLSDALKLIGTAFTLVLSFQILTNNISLEKLRNEENADSNDDVLDDEADKDMDNNAVDGPTVFAHVELARTICKYIASSPSR
jgi:hypothetical protein